MEFLGIACSRVLVSFGLKADTFSRFSGVVSGMREMLLLRTCVVFARIRSGGGRSIGNRLEQGLEAVSSRLVTMCITGRGIPCTYVALEQ